MIISNFDWARSVLDSFAITQRSQANYVSCRGRIVSPASWHPADVFIQWAPVVGAIGAFVPIPVVACLLFGVVSALNSLVRDPWFWGCLVMVAVACTFPPLAVVLPFVGVALLLRRWALVVYHLKAIGLGLGLYAVATLVSAPLLLYCFFGVLLKTDLLGRPVELQVVISAVPILGALAVPLVWYSARVLDGYVQWAIRTLCLDDRKYDPRTALSVMLGTPIILATLILSIVGLVIELLPDFGVSEGVAPGDAAFEPGRVGNFEPAPAVEGPVPFEAVGAHGHGHWSSTDSALYPPEPVVHVQAHVRTAPDGIVENNLSFHGESHVSPAAPSVVVQSHVRTMPDGSVANNLSTPDDAGPPR